MSLLQLLRKPAERNLLDVLTKLPQLGVGSKVTRKSWEPYGDSYWEVTKVAPRNADGSYGKVSSIFDGTAARQQQAPPPRCGHLHTYAARQQCCDVGIYIHMQLNSNARMSSAQ
jgi:hypothetical protein